MATNPISYSQSRTAAQAVVPNEVVVHKGAHHSRNYDDAFVCLDQTEFTASELLSTIKDIRRDSPLVPIVVIGRLLTESAQMITEEISSVVNAGAIFFERSSDRPIEEIAHNIYKDLLKVYKNFQPLDFVTPEPAEGSLTDEQRKDLEFYYEAPFRLPESSVRTLIERINTRDTEPTKND